MTPTQEIRAKALECAIATIAVLPEQNRIKQIADNVKANISITAMIERQANHYVSFINDSDNPSI